MLLNEYQRAAMGVATHTLRGPRICLEYGALALCGEAGKLANIVKKNWRETDVVGCPLTLQGRDQALLELGDVLWYAAFLAEVLGTTLELVAKKNIEKLQRRKAPRLEGGL